MRGQHNLGLTLGAPNLPVEGWLVGDAAADLESVGRGDLCDSSWSQREFGSV